MHVYLLINSLAGGGAERVAINLNEALNIEKVFLLERDIRYKISEKKLIFLSHHTLKTTPLIKTLYIPFYALRLIKYIKKESIVISMLERANYVNVLASLLKGHKAVISVRMSQREGRKKFHPYNLITRLLYPKASRVVCVSKAIARELEFHYGVPKEKLRVIYNPLDIERIYYFRREDLREFLPIFASQVLITAGRLTMQKGQWFLLRIFRELKKALPSCKLVILGEGELKDYLVSLSEELGLRTYLWDRDKVSEDYDVYFIGFQANPYKFLAKSKLFIFPSLWEGFPNALIEAMACGVPVISADCKSGPREILAPQTDFESETKEPEFAEYGILMPVLAKRFKNATDPLDNVEKMWLDTLIKVLSEEELLHYYRLKAQERAEDFKIEKIAQEWRKVLEEV